MFSSVSLALYLVVKSYVETRVVGCLAP
jgi:hypothetical protein